LIEFVFKPHGMFLSESAAGIVLEGNHFARAPIPHYAWPRSGPLLGELMAATSLDSNIALILIDLQEGIVGLPTVHAIGPILERASALAAAFRHRRLPVVLVNVDGAAPGRTEQPRRGPFPTGFSDLVAELNQQPEDHRVTKRTWGAFTNTGLSDHLERIGVTQVVICGVATSIGVESTARQAHERGLNVVLAIDAMTDMNAEAHENSISRIFPRLGETATTQQIVDLLNAPRASSETA
jgi:nicotinamidase-related amidase